MPLNALQRETLYTTLTSYVDTILEVESIPHSIKIQWLQAIISETLPSIAETVQTLQQHPDLIAGLVRDIKVPGDIRVLWSQLVPYLNNNATQLPPDSLLQQLKIVNNYNPVLMADMKLFENACMAEPAINGIQKELICLRELFLEMTPVSSYSYGNAYRTFYFRIGTVPFNLDQCGPTPLKGELHADVILLINDRIEQAEKREKLLEEEKRHQKERQDIAIARQSQEEASLALAVTLHLGEVDSQRVRESYKREIVSSFEMQGDRADIPHSLNALLFGDRAQREMTAHNCVLYLLTDEDLSSFDTSAIQKAVVLIYKENGASSSSGLRHFDACFIEQGKWVQESNNRLIVDMGELKPSDFPQKGLLAEKADTVKIMQDAIIKRNQLTTQRLALHTVAHQSEHEKRFSQMEGALSNRLTHVVLAIKDKITKLDITLKQSPKYLELRKAEFYKVLLEVQIGAVSGCDNTVSWDIINQNYQQQLSATYEMYIEDMCVKWLANRANHLPEEELKTIVEDFKRTINQIMSQEVAQFKAFKLTATSIKKINQLNSSKKRLDAQITALKEVWDNAIEPLASLANECLIVRRVRNDIQDKGISVWPESLQILCDIAKNILQEAPDTLDFDKLTLLDYACWCGHLTLVKGLIEQKHNIVVAGSQDGHSAMHFAVENMSDSAIPLLEFLLQKYPDANTLRTKKGKIPLHIAASNGNIRTVTWLLQKLPSSVNLEDNSHLTPLHEAARYGHSDTVQHLLSLGANARVLDRNQNTPVGLAVLGGYTATVQVFFNHGVWLTKEESIRLEEAIEKNPNAPAIIESIAIAARDTIIRLSSIIPRTTSTRTQNRSESLAREDSGTQGVFPMFEMQSAQLRTTSNASSPRASEMKQAIER